MNMANTIEIDISFVAAIVMPKLNLDWAWVND
jgi:hypothetical protein